YIWFSSNQKNGGASSGSPVHFSRVWRAERTGRVIITEGALKADVIAEYKDCCVVGVPGVSSFNADFGAWLKKQLPIIQNVQIAYDSDWREKPQVFTALKRLTDYLSGTGLAGGILIWNDAKGLDDLLNREVSQ